MSISLFGMAGPTDHDLGLTTLTSFALHTSRAFSGPQPPSHAESQSQPKELKTLAGGGGGGVAAEAPEQKEEVPAGSPAAEPTQARGVRPEAREMTQKQTLFKGQSKKKTVPPNRHGKAPHVRKGTRAGTDCGAPPAPPRLGLALRCLLFSVDAVDCSLG